MDEKPPTEAESSAQADDAPEARKVEPAPIIAIGGVRVRRGVEKKDGSLAWQKLGKLRHWEGPSMVNVTRIAIEDSGADPFYVAAYVVRHLPLQLRADCANADRDPVEVGQAVAPLLVDDGSGSRKCKRWRNPEAVLLEILRQLGHPRPDNLVRE